MRAGSLNLMGRGGEGGVWLKALFFVYFHPFSWISWQDFIQSKKDSVFLESLGQWNLDNFWMIFRTYYVFLLFFLQFANWNNRCAIIFIVIIEYTRIQQSDPTPTSFWLTYSPQGEHDKYDNCKITSFYYNYRNPWVCCFLVQIKAIVL